MAKKTAPNAKANAKANARANAKANGGAKKEKQQEKQIKVPKIVKPNFEVSEEVDIDEDDIEFFKEHGTHSSFLTKMDTVKLSKNEIIKAKKQTTFGNLKKSSEVQTADDVDSEPESEPESEPDVSDIDDDDASMEIDMEDGSDIERDEDDEAMFSDVDYDYSDDDEGDDMEEEEDEDEDKEEKAAKVPAAKAVKAKAQAVKQEKRVELDSDEEQDYEQAPRRPQGWDKKQSTRLPIKLADGRIQELEDDRIAPSELKRMQEEEEEEEEEEVEAQEAEEEEETVFTEPVPETKLSKKEQLAQKKEELAEIAQLVISDPEKNIGQLKRLRNISQDPNDAIKKLALLTQLAVFKDILPGYRIRPLTEKERAVQVSKEVAKTRDYEQSLLQNYQNYLVSLEKILSQDKSGKEEDDAIAAQEAAAAAAGEIRIRATSTTAILSSPAPVMSDADAADRKRKADLATVAIHCMCTLLTSVTHFNFRLNLMTAIIARMSRRRWSETSETCSKALREVFVEDESGEASLDAVKLITKMIKAKSYLVHPNVISCFLSLRLKEELPTRAGGDDDENPRKRKKKEKVHISKKNRKLLKAKKEVEAEMKEAEAVVDKEEKVRTHTETLKMVFVTYFRILKNASSSPLLPAVLEGLAKFAHLINVDFFIDLLEVLKKIMHGGSDAQQFDPHTPINRRRQLLCIVCAFQLMQGQGEALNMDLKAFYVEFYTILQTVAMSTDLEGNVFEAAEQSTKEKEEQAQLAKMKRRGRRSDKDDKKEEVLVVLGTERELILKGFELMFFANKGKIPPIRAASFLKRLAIATLQVPNKSAKECLMVMKRLIQKQPQVDQLLTGTDEDRAGNGVYMPFLNDPELCNPMASSLWEFELMKSHFDPKVRSMAKQLSVFTPSVALRTHDRGINH
ncbi:hypothetical protein DFQ27_002622 [Actinomortierella ambigua]|uniref:Nucleolar complex-associated protein 3 n=1 Tax=Actinomortierella ambigua TaxID=1343610 RepID=A0A9P6QJX5_9FUNG|nr:hypothetical protein DFQ27_002622 [Actinomortierella ambigua]